MVLISGTTSPDNGKPSVGDYLLRELPIDGGEPRELARFFGGPGALGPAPWSTDGKQAGVREPRAGIAQDSGGHDPRGWCRISVMRQLLDNIMWNCMSGPHAKFATGAGAVRRYAPGFSPIVGCQDPEHPDFATLEKYCEPGESFYLDIWSGIRARRLAHRKRSEDVQDGLGGAAARRRCGARTPSRFSQLISARRWSSRSSRTPGPSVRARPSWENISATSRASELIAMAGERMCAGDLHEVSGICTHPEYQGRGLARKLTLKLVRRQLQRGKTPFLHVMSHNTAARALYEKMGFRNYRETLVRVALRVSSGLRLLAGDRVPVVVYPQFNGECGAMVTRQHADQLVDAWLEEHEIATFDFDSPLPQHEDRHVQKLVVVRVDSMTLAGSTSMTVPVTFKAAGPVTQSSAMHH